MMIDNLQIAVVGLNHKCASVELREKIAFSSEEAARVLSELKLIKGIQETVVLSTCNRVEIYAAIEGNGNEVNDICTFLNARAMVCDSELGSHLYVYNEPDSIRHLFSVACGLDSMILGESEILQQVRKAYEVALSNSATGTIFNVLFQKALNAAKEVRAGTSLGFGSLSIGTVAVELAQTVCGSLENASVLLIGAGKVSELALRRLADRGAKNIRIMNRSFEKAKKLASEHLAQAVIFENLEEELDKAEIVISSTSSNRYLIGPELLSYVVVGRKKPICLIDLGVPRNIDPLSGRLEGVHLFNIDDLRTIAISHELERKQEIEKVRKILERKLEHFLSWREKQKSRCVLFESELAQAL